MTPTARRVMRLPEVQNLVGLSRVQIWRKSNDANDDFPVAVTLGPNSIAWHSHEIEAWLASRPRRGACPDTASAEPTPAT